MLCPCLYHRRLCKFAETQKGNVYWGLRCKLKVKKETRKILLGKSNSLTSATLLGTPSPSTSRANTGCGIKPLTPEQRLNASLRRCISSSVTKTSFKQTKRESAVINNETYFDLANRSFNRDLKTYLSLSLPRRGGSKVLTPLDP